MNIKNSLTFKIFLILIILIAGRSFAEHDSNEIKFNIQLLLENNSCVHCNLQGANLNRAELASADMSGANLRGATFSLATLTCANFQNSDLRETEFGGSDISGADFRGANIASASFSGAYKKGAVFGDKTQDRNSSKAEIKKVGKSDDTNVKNTHKMTVNESRTTVQSEILNPQESLPTSSNGPPLKKINPIPKAIFYSR